VSAPGPGPTGHGSGQRWAPAASPSTRANGGTSTVPARRSDAPGSTPRSAEQSRDASAGWFDTGVQRWTRRNRSTVSLLDAAFAMSELVMTMQLHRTPSDDEGLKPIGRWRGTLVRIWGRPTPGTTRSSERGMTRCGGLDVSTNVWCTGGNEGSCAASAGTSGCTARCQLTSRLLRSIPTSERLTGDTVPLHGRALLEQLQGIEHDADRSPGLARRPDGRRRMQGLGQQDPVRPGDPQQAADLL
jgi:hypothetical protein